MIYKETAKQIYNDYCNGVPTDEICDKYNIARFELANVVEKQENKIERAKEREAEKEVKILQMYRKGVAIEEIAKECKMTLANVRKVLKSHDLPYDRKRKKSELDNRIIAEYKQGKTPKELAEAYNMTLRQIYYVLKVGGIDLKQDKMCSKVVQSALLADRTVFGWQARIAKEHGISRQRVNTILKKEGII